MVAPSRESYVPFRPLERLPAEKMGYPIPGVRDILEKKVHHWCRLFIEVVKQG
jgi:hypothetical protein